MVNQVESLSHDSRAGFRGALLATLVRVFSLGWLTGPIFDKELRVSSRRRRNYVLRSAYVVLFLSVLALMWLIVAWGRTSSLEQASRMTLLGRQVAIFVLWFQFVAAQVVAVVMLSTSISDEIYKRTLGVLMTTPISGVQIVLGKLLSRLLQVVLMMAITLPLLAVVRAFGGLPWDYLICSLCVTLATIVFLGSLSLFFSILSRRAYVAVIRTGLVAFLLFLAMPYTLEVLARRTIHRPALFNVFSYVNPYAVMARAVEALLSAQSMRSTHWQICCLVAVVVSLLLLLVSAVLVRRAALWQIAGEPHVRRVRRRPKEAAGERAVRRVTGQPVLWKERRTASKGRRKLGVIVLAVCTVILLGMTYVRCALQNALSDESVHAGYVVIFLGLGMLVTAVLPATAITSEKESGTWTLLLTTTLTDWEILWGKLLGAVRRCLPAWAFLFGHVALFTMAGIIHPIGLLQLAILAAWIIFFLSGAGLCFSALLRHTTAAVIANVALAGGLWIAAPVLLGLAVEATGANDDVLKLYLDTNPIVHAVVITLATTRTAGMAAYDWCRPGLANVGKATGWILLNFVLYTVLGLGFLALARLRFRRNPL